MSRNTSEPNRELDEFKVLIRDLEELRSDMLKLEESYAVRTSKLHNLHEDSARNLIHYVALRGRDIRHLQEKLAAMGLSSLGRTESQVMASVDGVLALLNRMAVAPAPGTVPAASSPASNKGKALLEANTTALLGPKPSGRSVRIMVTMPTEAGRDYELVYNLVKHGMDCMRVNCAHDNPETWTRMIEHLKRARQTLRRPCSLLMDVPGPKLRTGPVELGPPVIKIRPHRDDLGNVTAPARIWLTAVENSEPPPCAAEAQLAVPNDWLSLLRPGDVVEFHDARGSDRSMKIADIAGENRWAEAAQTAYIVPETQLYLQGHGETDHIATVSGIRPKEKWLLLKPGDTLILTRALSPGRPAAYDDQGRMVTAATIGVTLPEVFDNVRAGEAIWFDDGRIGGVIRSVAPNQICVEITHARAKGEKLGADKGVNLPDSDLHLPALTETDLEILKFIVQHADLVGYSFVRDEKGVRQLQARLAKLGGSGLGIVLKIETRNAFERLPELLLASMHSARIGVMIARGDLAVECGYERLAEVQEEILWFAEAARVPVIWATQVLENLAKEGVPSRAEITDAAMSERAECVMLNKGPYVVDAVRALDDILRRMEAHQTKKRPMLRRLGLAVAYSSGS